MSRNSGAIGFGGFLLGLGIGYLIFRNFALSLNDAAILLIILGVAIILTTIVRSVASNYGLHRIIGGFAGGLILSLILTQGLGLATSGNSPLPYSKTETMTYSGASNFNEVSLKLGSMNGEITLSTWNKPEFSIASTITAMGMTQQDADNSFANLPKNLVNTNSSTKQSLTLVFSPQDTISNPFKIRVDVKLPANSILDLDLTTSNAMIIITNVNGDNVNLRTSNSAIRFNNVNSTTVTGETSNSQITGTVTSTTCNLSTSNGPISIQVHSGRIGDYKLQTSNSNIDVTIPTKVECRVDASTSNSDVSIAIPNFVYSLNKDTSKAGQTSDFDSASIRISVEAQTSNSAIRIHN